MSEELQGTVRKIRFQNVDSGFTIGTVEHDRTTYTFKGNVVCKPGDSVTLSGKWIDDPKWGRQFDAKTGRVKMDESPDALVRLLATRSEFKGIGKVRAQQVVDAALTVSTDGEAISAILADPMSVAAASGVSIDLVKGIGEVWRVERDGYAALTDLVDQGWTNGQANQIVNVLGLGAPSMVRADPYSLIGKIPRFGFRTIDIIARALGISSTDPRRIECGVAYCLDNIASTGATWTTRDGLLDEAMSELRPDTLDAEDLIFSALDKLIADGVVYRGHTPGGIEMVADAHVARIETEVFDELLDRLRDDSLSSVSYKGPRAENAVGTVNAGQGDALLAAFRYRACVISGAGGVGKTYTMRAVCDVAQENGMRVGLCAPTGKAARKLSHSTARSASTIHRLLGPVFDEDTGGFRFTHNAGNQLDLDLVVVDEFSMCDVRLMHSLLAALPDHCRLLMVGDHNQIPPVGAGAILRDILAGRKGYADAVIVLTEIVRQAGDLARHTTAILDGIVPPMKPGAVDWQIHQMERGHEEASAAMIADIVEMVVMAPKPLQPFGRKLEMDWDVQVLAPMRKGPLGTYALNVHLQRLNQRILGNPDPEPTDDNKAPKPLVGDRVIWTKNDYALDLSNGTQAIVTGINKGSMDLFTEDGREVTIPPAKRINVQVAYAMTVHKSQGSEWPFVVLVASSSHWVMHDRNLLYTGASRASESLMIAADSRGLSHFASERKSEMRSTFGQFLVDGWRPNAEQPQDAGGDGSPLRLV